MFLFVIFSNKICPTLTFKIKYITKLNVQKHGNKRKTGKLNKGNEMQKELN